MDAPRQQMRKRPATANVPLRTLLLVLLFSCGDFLAARAQTTLISTGAVWRYFPVEAGAPANWNATNFNDSAWLSGSAQLGYGDGDERTPIWAGPGLPPITTFLRRSFVLSNPREFFNLTLRLLADDGAAVYLNGTEIFRHNLPAGAIAPSTPALVPVSGADESVFQQTANSPYRLIAGTNVVAVELHQNTDGPPDASFDLELIGNLPLTPPTVEITSPANGSVLSPGSHDISVSFGDLDGYVYLVQFYTNGVPLGSSVTPPFVFPWLADVPGRYRLHARAVDNSGRSSQSAPVYVQMGDVTEDRVVRGPYLQSGSSTGIVVRWRTDWFTESVVRYGTTASLLQSVKENDSKTEHEVELTGLRPDTKYFYSVGTATRIIEGGTGHHFITAPTNARPTRVWVIGDSGTADIYAAAVRDAYLEANDRHTDLWLMLGDNAYEEGLDEQYQDAVFEMYPGLLRQSVVWPTVGNHDAAQISAAGGFPYLDLFTLPRQGEAGGLPSGTEKYYSFDYGNIHFVCLDSASSTRAPQSPMLTWLESDLTATDKDWIIAFWHHPPYSFGTHNSDWELELIEMRRHVLPILEDHGVDLVLSGHSHNYERSMLLHGFYGNSSNLVSAMILNGDSGNPLLEGAYQKPAGGLGARQGTVYAVCGCSGQGGTFAFPKHPAMFTHDSGFGSMVLDIDGLRLDAKFLRPNGDIDDQFAIVKGMPAGDVRPSLRITQTGAQVEIWWPTSLLPFELESSNIADSGVPWAPVLQPAATVGRQHRVTLDSGGEHRFFRLRVEP